MLLAFGPSQDLDLFNYFGNEIVEAQGLTKESRCKYLLLLLCFHGRPWIHQDTVKTSHKPRGFRGGNNGEQAKKIHG